MSLLPAVKSAGDESTTGEVLPRRPAPGNRVSAWSWSWWRWWSPPVISALPGEAGGDDTAGGGIEPTLGERGGDASWLRDGDQAGDTVRGLRLRLPVLLRRLLRTGDGGVPAAAVVPSSMVGARPPEGGGVSVRETVLAGVVGSAVSDREVTMNGGEATR